MGEQQTQTMVSGRRGGVDGDGWNRSSLEMIEATQIFQSDLDNEVNMKALKNNSFYKVTSYDKISALKIIRLLPMTD